MSIDFESEVKEKEVPDWPGWKKLQLGGSRRYVSPGGVEVSASRFMDLAKKYAGQKYIPESDILPPTKQEKSKPSFFTSASSGLGSASQTPTKPTKTTDQPSSYSEIATSVKPSSRPLTKHKKPNAIALAIGFKMLFLLITTGIIVRLLQDERAAMTEQEATVLGNALGNLLQDTGWNENWGWLVAETGDWQAIGYVAVTYAGRLGDIIMEKKAREQSTRPVQQNVPGPTGAGVNAGTSQPSSNGHAVPGASLPYTPSGVRGFTRPA